MQKVDKLDMHELNAGSFGGLTLEDIVEHVLAKAARATQPRPPSLQRERRLLVLSLIDTEERTVA